jgi:hypothetical protein
MEDSMRKSIFAVAALVASAWGVRAAVAEDLEILDPQISQAFAQVLAEAAEKQEKPKIKIQGDIEKACGVHREQVGVILVPQKDLSAENIPDGVNSDPGAPLGHLFMSKGFAPVIDGKPVDKSKLGSVKFTGQDGNEQEVNYLAVAARHTDDDVWHLYLYGADDKPLLDAQIGEGAGPGTQPLALEIKDVEDNTGTAYVTIYDRFQANFKINYKPE